MPVTGNPIVDWVMTILGGIAALIGAAALVWGRLRALPAEGPANGVRFGRREGDPHIRVLADKQEAIADKVQEHDTKIIVLETKEKAVEETVVEVKSTIEKNRIEQRRTNEQLFGKLDEHQRQMTEMERGATARHDEIKNLLLGMKRQE